MLYLPTINLTRNEILSKKAIAELSNVLGSNSTKFINLVASLQHGVRSHLITTGAGTNANALWGVICKLNCQNELLSASAQWRFKNINDDELLGICKHISAVNTTVATSPDVVGSLVVDYLPDMDTAMELLDNNQWLVFCYFIIIGEKVVFKDKPNTALIITGA